MRNKLASVRKAIAGGVVAAVPLLFPALADGVLDGAEIGGLVAAFLAGAGVVFVVPNRTAPTTPTVTEPLPK